MGKLVRFWLQVLTLLGADGSNVTSVLKPFPCSVTAQQVLLQAQSGSSRLVLDCSSVPKTFAKWFLGSLPHMCNSGVKLGFLLVHSQNKGLSVSSSLLTWTSLTLCLPGFLRPEGQVIYSSFRCLYHVAGAVLLWNGGWLWGREKKKGKKVDSEFLFLFL